MKYKLVLFLYLFIRSGVLCAQLNTVSYHVRLDGMYSSGTFLPFWMHNNEYGRIPFNPQGAVFSGGFYKPFLNHNSRFDYSVKAELAVQQTKSNTRAYFHELYAATRYKKLEMLVGSRVEHIGNHDSTLSCGGFLFSHNSRAIPKVSVGFERFVPIGFTGGFLEIKGKLVHGWFLDNVGTTNSLLHHKNFYFRLGGRHIFHFQYGVEHAAQWGGKHPIQGEQPSGLKDFIKILAGKSGGDDANLSDQINALGNHIISQNMKFELDISNYSLAAYWQNLSEDKPIKFMLNSMNRSDGLWGLSIRTRNKAIISGFLYEFLNTTDQSGPFHDKDGIVYGGADGYYLNGAYSQGWSYYGRTIGTPFISSPFYFDKTQTINNRVKVHHIGLEGSLLNCSYRFLASYHRNYGIVRVALPYSGNNYSTMFELNRVFPKLAGIECSLKLGADFGSHYGRSTGVLFSLRKQGILFRY